MKIALVHDQLHEFGGAERVFLLLKNIFPDADVFTSFYTPSQLDKNAPDWKTWNLRASWIQNIPGISRLISPLRFLDPWIWESFDFTGYDVVISSSGGHMCKGIITKPETIHISYIHHQPRYLYYYATARNWQKYVPIRIYGHFINHFLRLWDFVGSQRPTILVANSEETKRRIKKFYRRDSVVIYPPVKIPTENISMFDTSKRSYYVTLSRLVASKNIELLMKTAQKNNFSLKIIGTGKDEDYLKRVSNKNIEFLGRVEDDALSDIYIHAKAFLNGAEDEEFGIAPVEAMSYGVPVIAYASAGLLETVDEGENGYLYSELTVESLSEAIGILEKLSQSEYIEMRKKAREDSKKYSEEVFKKKILKLF